jgi:antitoxin ParD1/3/4
MNISLPPQLEKFVKRKVASGKYGSASEVIREALRLMDEVEKERKAQLEELRREIQVGIDEADRGELYDVDEVMHELIEKYKPAEPIMNEVEKERKAQLDELRQQIQVGIDDVEEGRVRDAKEAVREIRERYRGERRARGNEARRDLRTRRAGSS